MDTASVVLSFLLQTASISSIGITHEHVNTAEVHCLAENVFFEARGEPKHGQYAVAHVTLNRVKHPSYPDTVCEVVGQKTKVRATGKTVCAFSWKCSGNRRISFKTRDGKENHRVIEQYKIALTVAIKTLYGKAADASKGAISFHNPHVSAPGWASRMRLTTKIGNHAFYR